MAPKRESEASGVRDRGGGALLPRPCVLAADDEVEK